MVCDPGSVFHGSHGAVDQIRRIPGRLGAFGGQISHFPCHHSKSLACLPHTRCFHSRIKRQDIGLERNVLNGLYDLGYLTGTGTDLLHGCKHVLHPAVALRRFPAHSLCSLAGIRGAVRIGSDLPGYLPYADRQLLHCSRLLRRPLGQGLGACRHLLGTIAYLLRRNADLPQCFVQGLHNPFQGFLYKPEVADVCSFYPKVQVSAGYLLQYMRNIPDHIL